MIQLHGIMQCACGRLWRIMQVGVSVPTEDTDGVLQCVCGQKLVTWSGRQKWEKEEAVTRPRDYSQ